MGRLNPRPKERRRRQRADVALTLKIEYNKEGILTKTKNINALGTYTEIAKEIPVGTDLNIRIELPKRGCAKAGRPKKINCAGVVFRCQPVFSAEGKNQYGIGIFFRSFLEKGEKELSGYVDYLLLQERKIGRMYMRKRKQKLLKEKGGKR